MKILETDRLILRQLSTEDAAFILELVNEPSFIQNIGDRGVRTLEDARAYILRVAISSYEKNGFGLYLVELKDSGQSIGMCGLIKRDGLEDVDIGYAFLPRFWLKGYAVEAAAAIGQVYSFVAISCQVLEYLSSNNKVFLGILLSPLIIDLTNRKSKN